MGTRCLRFRVSLRPPWRGRQTYPRHKAKSSKEILIYRCQILATLNKAVDMLYAGFDKDTLIPPADKDHGYKNPDKQEK